MKPYVTYVPKPPAKPTTPPKPAPPKKRITEEEPPAPPPALTKPRKRHPSPVFDPATNQPYLSHYFLFGEGWIPTRIHAKCNRVAEPLGARFYRVCIPNVGWRYWFMVFNDGTPLDTSIVDKVIAGLIAKNVYLPNQLLPGQPPKPTP